MIIQALVAAVLLFLLSAAIKQFFTWLRLYTPPLKNTPIIGLHGWGFAMAQARWNDDLAGLLDDGSRQLYDQIYQIWTPIGFEVVLPRRFVPELQNRPAECVSFIERSQVSWGKGFMDLRTGFGDAMAAIKNPFNTSIAQTIPSLVSEVRRTINEEFGIDTDWTTVKLHNKLRRITMVATGSAFVGAGLSRQRNFSDALHGYISSATDTVHAVDEYSPILQPLVTPFLRSAARIKHFERQYAQLVRAYLDSTPKDERAPSLLDALQAKYAAMGEHASFHESIHHILLISLDTNYNLMQVLSQTLLDLAVRPDYANELRAEALATFSDTDVPLAHSLSKLPKLDSFVQESQRLNPMDNISFLRRTLQPVQLSDGTTLPAHTNLCIHSYAYAQDVGIWGANAAEFDGFRFLRAHDSDNGNGNDNDNSNSEKQTHKQAPDMSAIRDDVWLFGKGRWACPGRLLAASMIKAIVAELLVRFEFDVADSRGAEPFRRSGISVRADADALVVRMRKIEKKS